MRENTLTFSEFLASIHLKAGDLWVHTGQMGNFKTQLVLEVMLDYLARDLRVLYVNRDPSVTRKTVHARLSCIASSIVLCKPLSYKDARYGYLSPEDEKLFREASEILDGLTTIRPDWDQTYEDIEEEIGSVSLSVFDLLVVDHCEMPFKTLKGLAHIYNCPVLTTRQLNRSPACFGLKPMPLKAADCTLDPEAAKYIDVYTGSHSRDESGFYLSLCKPKAEDYRVTVDFKSLTLDYLETV